MVGTTADPRKFDACSIRPYPCDVLSVHVCLSAPQVAGLFPLDAVVHRVCVEKSRNDQTIAIDSRIVDRSRFCIGIPMVVLRPPICIFSSDVRY